MDALSADARKRKPRSDRRLTDEQIAVIRSAFAARRSTPSDHALAKLYGVSVRTVRRYGRGG